MAATEMALTAGAKSSSYMSPQHGSTVVFGFQRLWQNSLLCDTHLVVQGQTFQVHRSFLAACSQYFFSMFAEGFSETEQKVVELKGVTAQALRAVLDYAYTGKIIINGANFQDVLEAAGHLQFTEILGFCSQYLNNELTADNCLQILNMGEVYGLIECKQEAKRYILENFIPVSENEDFKTITADLLCEFLADDKLQAHSELNVFRVVMKWLEANNAKPEVAKKVLGLIRYGLMNAEQFEQVHSNKLMLSESCRDILQSALNYHIIFFNQPMIGTMLSRMRAYQESLVVFGAGYPDNTYSNMLAARVDGGNLHHFVNLSTSKERWGFRAVAVVNNFVYVVGCHSAMAGNSVFRYNPRDGKWLQVSSMTVPRINFALIALPTCLIAVGGRHNLMALNSTEKYDFSTNEWSVISNLPNTLYDHAGCCHGNKVYISGGWSGEDFTKDVFCYDLDRAGWQIRAPLHQKRGYHVMVTQGNQIFACTGVYPCSIPRTECYNVEHDQWTILSPALHNQCEASAVKCGTKIYILGGYTWYEDHIIQDTIQCYDLENDSWSVVKSNLPETITREFVACHLQLPLHLFPDHVMNTSKVATPNAPNAPNVPKRN